MGTVTVTNTQIENEDINLSKLIIYAGGTQTDVDNALYDYASEVLTVPTIDSTTLQTALSNYTVSFDAEELANIDDIKDEQYRRIDIAAGLKRDEYITVTEGQEMTYIRKAEDAQAYIDAGYPGDSSPYLWVDAEATATGQTATVVADNIKAQNDAWVVAGTAIEAVRIGKKFAILNATTVSDVRTLGDQAITDLEAI